MLYYNPQMAENSIKNSTKGTITMKVCRYVHFHFNGKHNPTSTHTTEFHCREKKKSLE
jgi:hypothetical protein